MLCAETILSPRFRFVALCTLFNGDSECISLLHLFCILSMIHPLLQQTVPNTHCLQLPVNVMVY